MLPGQRNKANWPQPLSEEPKKGSSVPQDGALLFIDAMSGFLEGGLANLRNSLTGLTSTSVICN